MADFRVLIPAAGRGTRAGLLYPKTLYPVDGTPILHRLLAALSIYDPSPTVIVSPQGEPLIRDSLSQTGLDAHLVIQPEPRGMGDAVLRFEYSPVASEAHHVLLAWGDLAHLQPSTVSALAKFHIDCDNDFTLVSRLVDRAYTQVQRNRAGRVVAVSESREQGVTDPQPGEREIGLFAFRKQPIFELLRADVAGKLGASSREHGFLYVVEHLVRNGAKVEALPIATELDLVSLNSVSDLSHNFSASAAT
jgi:bifunctional UDP-N-acetylglucosamine pyrophosphorylase / glucosamine-1-phosphate N-acetyltransferase